MIIEVKPVEEKFGVYINGELLGTSKHQYDADYAAQLLRRHTGGDSEQPNTGERVD